MLLRIDDATFPELQSGRTVMMSSSSLALQLVRVGVAESCVGKQPSVAM
jgi:hypothetical protein